MTSRTADDDEGEIGEARIVPDFAPPPGRFVPCDDGVKVTLTLSRRSVDFFKRQAERHHCPTT